MGPLLRWMRSQAGLLLVGLAACASPAVSVPPTPEPSVCGDARVQSGEECDDANRDESVAVSIGVATAPEESSGEEDPIAPSDRSRRTLERARRAP